MTGVQTCALPIFIAFPKAGGGRDPLTGAPAPISDEQRAETGVDYDPDAEEN